MSAEFYRKEYGETPQGYVTVIGFRGGYGAGGIGDTSWGTLYYVVRRGGQTDITVDTEAAADIIASAMVGSAPTPVVVERIVEVPAPARARGRAAPESEFEPVAPTEG